MGNFFGLFNYNKEGPGVYLNEPPKGPFKTFMGILSRKFWKLAIANLMYVLFSLPFIILAFFVSAYLMPMIFPSGWETLTAELLATEEVVNVADQSQDGAAGLMLFAVFAFTMLLVGLQTVVLGPVHAGLTVIFRNYAREEHAFLWGDFKEAFKKNWKQSTVVSLIGIVFILVLGTNFSFYSNSQIVENGFLSIFLSGVVVLLTLIFIFLQMFIYPMMITFKLSIKQLYKNSVLLALAKLPQNILIFVLNIIILVVLPIGFLLIPISFSLGIYIFYYVFIGFGLNLMLTNFYAYRQLNRYMIEPGEKKDEVDDLIENEEDEAVFKDTKV